MPDVSIIINTQRAPFVSLCLLFLNEKSLLRRQQAVINTRLGVLGHNLLTQCAIDALPLQIPVPPITASSSRWSWDPEEERKRQERWQKEQERLLQVQIGTFA